MEIDELDKDYEADLRKIITKDQYGEFTDIIVEIMLRRQAEFDISYERIIDEANNLVKRLPNIKVVPFLPNAYAVTLANIWISADKYTAIVNGDKQAAEDLYETLTHEVYHVIASRGFLGVDGSAVFDTKHKSRGFNELINEAAANRAATNYSEEEKRSQIRETQSYEILTMFSPLIATALGCSEKEFLAAGTSQNANEELIDLLTKHMNKSDEKLNQLNRENAKDLIDTLSSKIETLHNLDYRLDMTTLLNRRETRVKALNGVMSSLIQIVNFRIENDNRSINSELVEEYAYSYKALVGLGASAIEMYKNKATDLMSESTKEEIDNIMNSLAPELEDLCNRVIGLREVTKHMYTDKNPNEMQKMIEEAKNGRLIGETSVSEEFNIQLPNNKFEEIYSINTEQKQNYILKEDFKTEKWNNEEVIEMMFDKFKDQIKEKNKVIQFFRRGTNRISRWHKQVKKALNKTFGIRKTKELPSGNIEENIQYRENEYTNAICTQPNFYRNMSEMEQNKRRTQVKSQGKSRKIVKALEEEYQDIA